MKSCIRIRFAVFLAALLLLLPPAGVIRAQGNPFIGTRENGSQEEQDTARQERPSSARSLSGGGFGVRGSGGLARLQRRIYSGITEIVENFREERSFGIVVSLLGFMFLYGFIHALGPGHRKIILTSYFLSEKIRPLPGIAMAFSVAMLHGVSALVLIGLLFFVLTATISGGFNSVYITIERVSYGILVLLGVYLLIHTIRDGSAHTDVHQSGEDIRRPRFVRGQAGRILFVVTNGIVPCPGAAMILVFTFTFGFYSLGILSVLAMSLGMGVLLALVSSVVLYGKDKGLIRLLSGRKGAVIFKLIEILSAAAIILLGAVLLTGSLRIS